MTETNLNIILSNALCCSSELASKVSNMYSIGHKCAYSELIKLKLLNDRINILCEYKFPTIITETLTETVIIFEVTGDSKLFLEGVPTLGDPFSLIINNISYEYESDGVNTLLDQIITELTILGYYMSHSYNDITGTFTLKLTCNITNFEFTYTRGDVYEYKSSEISLGECNITIIEYVNCLTEDQMDEMSHKLMEQCEICDCQLNQDN